MIAVHQLAPAGSGRIVRLAEHTAALENVVLGSFNTDRPCRTRPGASAPILWNLFRVQFATATVSYELLGEVVGRRAHLEAVEIERPQPDGEITSEIEAIRLNDDQRLLLVALAEHHLRSPRRTSDVPTNRLVADRLGWSLTKYNRKLDNLCTKFDRWGVPGLKGDLSGMAMSRRQRLVQHVIETGVLKRSDLSLLDD